jgi:hypothetical protein
MSLITATPYECSTPHFTEGGCSSSRLLLDVGLLLDAGFGAAAPLASAAMGEVDETAAAPVDFLKLPSPSRSCCFSNLSSICSKRAASFEGIGDEESAATRG